MGQDRDHYRAVPERGPPFEPSVPSGVVLDGLLSAAGQGDVGALGALYDETAPVVFGLLRGMLGSATRAERATERVYLGLWRSSPRFDPDSTSALSLLLARARRELAGDLITDDLHPPRHSNPEITRTRRGESPLA